MIALLLSSIDRHRDAPLSCTKSDGGAPLSYAKKNPAPGMPVGEAGRFHL